MIKVLFAEDDVFLGKIIKESLELRGFQIQWCKNGKEVIDYYYGYKTEIDICVIDIMMPLVSGHEVVTEIRKTNKSIPIIFLTAKTTTNDVIEGFELGANDYLKKPFSMEELIIRMNALLNRIDSSFTKKNNSEVTIGNYQFIPQKHELIFKNESKKLTSMESSLLELLYENSNQLLERNSTLKKLWGDDSFFNARSMDVFISKLRKYLSKDESIQIVNIRGKGYKLIVE